MAKNKKKLEENEIKYLKFKETYMNFQQIGQVPELPISRVLAVNIKKMKPIIEEMEEKMDGIIDKYAKVDENGKRLGILMDVKDDSGQQIYDDDGIKKQKRMDLGGNYHYDHVALVDEKKRDKYNAELEEFLEEVISYKFSSMPSNKMVTVRVNREYGKDESKEVKPVEIDMELLDVLEKKVSANMIVLLMDTIVRFVEDEE